ncbi:hypothetical protein EC919_104202 [Pseudomonas graminis]|uniref:hypothetical protein n=1 Tax=Pseudomonas graminis TaxID=158627 RepID=UPI00105E7F24|nr:hypothetical protein [Pseudomonas graminis]TDV54466.1 hypothetical protein EC919_104202 [Pseudomonas graminis]
MSESTNYVSVATIIPSASLSLNSALPTMGTRVMLSDGSELTGITSITMTAEPSGVWKATITVMPHHIEPITAEVIVIESAEASGPDDRLVEITSCGDSIRRLVKSIE